MTRERDTERESIEYVFGLTGGELADEPWAGETYWYDGIPEWAGDDHRDQYDAGVSYRTIVLDTLGDVHETIEDEDGTIWRRVAIYASSGETECPGRHEDEGPTVRADQAPPHDAETLASLRRDAKMWREGRWYGHGRFPEREDILRRQCPLCEMPVGEEHGFIYIGDGWAEVVYRAVASYCDVCNEEFPNREPKRHWECDECIAEAEEEAREMDAERAEAE